MRDSILLPICLLVLLLPRRRCYLKLEPPETHFFLAASYHLQSRQHRVLFTESSSTEAEQLCIEEEHQTSQLELELLAHLICTESDFPTFTTVGTSEAEVSWLYNVGPLVVLNTVLRSE